MLLAAAAYISAGFIALPPSIEIGAMSAVAVDQRDNIYVLHRGPRPLLKFDKHGKFVKAWGEGLFKVAHGLRIDRVGNVWTTDNGNHLLRKFSPGGELLATLGEGVLKAPDDIVFASDGSLFVADSGNGRIAHMTPDGKLIGSFGKRGQAEGEFATAHGLAIDAHDRLYVADRGNLRVQVFSPDGKLAAVWSGFGQPFCVAVVKDQLLISDGDANTISHVALETGKMTAQWGDKQTLQLPHIMAVDSRGRLFVAEVNGKRVQIFQPAAAVIASLEQQEQVEAAHRPIFQRGPEPAKAASAITAEAVRKLPARSTNAQPIPSRGYIDNHIFGRMDRDGVPHAPLSTDDEFARRAWLDATGRIPESKDLLAFLADADPAKRDKLIDGLVDSPEFIDKWTYYWEDLFRAGQRMGPGLNLFHYWMREWLRLDRPYSEVVTELLTGGGKSSFSVPGGLYFARDFVKAKDDPEEEGALDLVNIPDTVDEFTVTYSKVFLGLNLSCISCHDGRNHLEKVNLFLTGKKRENFFQQAGFYGKTRQIMNWENGNQANTEYTVDDLAPGYGTKSLSILRVPRSGGDSRPHFILSGEAARPGLNERDELARMLTSHIQFARAFTNRVWAELMGFGIVEPLEDFDLARYDRNAKLPDGWTLQPSNPELLDALARDFQQSNFSFKTMVKRIMKSNAYWLSSRFDGEWRESYAPYYARKFVRMLTAPELHDAITVATARLGSFKSGNRNVAMIQQMSEPKKASSDVQNFMRIFGQATRDDMPKKTMPSSLQAMMLMQSKVVTERVLALSSSRVDQLIKDPAASDAEIADSLYLATLSRRPTREEAFVALAALAKDRRRGAENLQWALINSPEFVFNY